MIDDIKKQVDFYLNLREEIRKSNGETLDLKTYEADMRHLIDTLVLENLLMKRLMPLVIEKV